MTVITITSGGGRYELTAEGHASGSPEACAGVSAILCALAGWLENAPAGVGVEKITTEPGRAALRFSGGAAAETAAELAEIGLRRIALAAPEAVRVEESRKPSPPGEAKASSRGT